MGAEMDGCATEQGRLAATGRSKGVRRMPQGIDALDQPIDLYVLAKILVVNDWPGGIEVLRLFSIIR